MCLIVSLIVSRGEKEEAGTYNNVEINVNTISFLSEGSKYVNINEHRNVPSDRLCLS